MKISLSRSITSFFLAHGAAHNVCAAKRIPRQRAKNLHHLFLIDDTAVRDVQYILQKRMPVRDLRRIVPVSI